MMIQSIRSRWQRLWLVGQATVILTLTRVGLRLLGFRRWFALLDRLARLSLRPLPAEKSERYLLQALRAVKVATDKTMPPQKWSTSCLLRSLTYWYLLRRRGLAAQLRFGTRQDPTAPFEAHAWVEYEGRRLAGGMPSEKFIPFDEEITPRRVS